MLIRTVAAVRYLTPLREGGSLPAIVEADDGDLYVLKFVGAGQGRKALIAELVAGEIARRLGLRVPELVFVTLDEAFGRMEPDPEIRGLLRASEGLNLGMRYLPEALAYSPLQKRPFDAGEASAIVWFDAYVTNVDRTPRNTNLLIWEKRLWLIDHGACLYFHHDWGDYLERSLSSFPQIAHHTLLRYASALEEAGAVLPEMLSLDTLAEITALIPSPWLADEPRFPGEAEHRQAYLDYLTRRLGASDRFVSEAIHARARPI